MLSVPKSLVGSEMEHRAVLGSLRGRVPDGNAWFAECIGVIAIYVLGVPYPQQNGLAVAGCQISLTCGGPEDVRVSFST